MHFLILLSFISIYIWKATTYPGFQIPSSSACRCSGGWTSEITRSQWSQQKLAHTRTWLLCQSNVYVLEESRKTVSSRLLINTHCDDVDVCKRCSWREIPFQNFHLSSVSSELSTAFSLAVDAEPILENLSVFKFCTNDGSLENHTVLVCLRISSWQETSSR